MAINAEARNEKDVKNDGKVLRPERCCGAMSHAFPLSSDADEARTRAKFDNGALGLTLPKRASAQTRRITIRSRNVPFRRAQPKVRQLHHAAGCLRCLFDGRGLVQPLATFSRIGRQRCCVSFLRTHHHVAMVVVQVRHA